VLLWRRYIPLEGRVSVTDQEMCNLSRLGRHGRKFVSPELDEQSKLVEKRHHGFGLNSAT